MIITYIIIVLCVLILIGNYVIENTEKKVDLASSGAIVFLMSFLWLAINGLATVASRDEIDSLKDTPIKEKVYSLDIKNGNEIRGSFFLGCGGFSSGNSTKYILFHENLGGKELLEVDATNTIVYEDENVSPYIIRKVHHQWDYSTYDKWFFFKMNKRDWSYVDKYKLHVPKNTIKINPMEIDISKLK